MSKFNEALSDRRFVGVEQRIREALDEESYKDFQEAIKDLTISSGSICKALRNLGVEVSDVSIQRMRRRD